ncbi:molybdenum cofactor guanylyltransferase [Lysobacter claricitrinus]|uniref:molybdenum cofactor guanylyltransferase n=1 Tax=Lysobacter claricitrinus TaxID=3367728 RepID=UPI0037DB3266
MLAVPRAVIEPFTGVVLAGGRSSRMGRDKAVLVLDGRTLLDRAIDVLRDAGATNVIVSGDRSMHDGVADRIPDAGPVGGIASVLSRVPDGAMVVIPVDVPLLDAVTLRTLVASLSEAPAACFKGHPLPWAVRVDARARDAVEQLLRDNPEGPSMRALHAAVAGIEITPPTADVLHNVNTPADLDGVVR